MDRVLHRRRWYCTLFTPPARAPDPRAAPAPHPAQVDKRSVPQRAGSTRYRHHYARRAAPPAARSRGPARGKVAAPRACMRACVRAVRGWGHRATDRRVARTHARTRPHGTQRTTSTRSTLLPPARARPRPPRPVGPRHAARFHRLLFNAKGAPRESERRGRAGTVGGYSQRYRARTTTAASRSRQRGRCRHLSRAHATASNVVARPPRSLARLPPNVPSSPVPLGVFFFSLSLSSLCAVI